MNKEEKNIMIRELTEKLTNNNVIYLADVSELNVEDTGKLRRACFNKKVSLNVVKKHLAEKKRWRTLREKILVNYMIY